MTDYGRDYGIVGNMLGITTVRGHLRAMAGLNWIRYNADIIKW